MNITINTIKNRVSVRTYQREELSKEVLEQIQNYIEHIENPFGVPITFKMLNAKEHNLSSPVILGANTYVGAKYKKGENAEVAFGYAAKERSIRENLMRKGMKSDERQPFSKLFFRNDFRHSLQESEAGQWLKGSILQKNPGISTAENVEYIATYQLED